MVKGHPDIKNMLGAGGRSFRGPWGESISSNITPHKGTGIGNYTDADIKRVITKGIKKDGTKLRPPMCTRCYDKMTDADLDAMVAYLKSIKPIKNDLQ